MDIIGPVYDRCTMLRRMFVDLHIKLRSDFMGRFFELRRVTSAGRCLQRRRMNSSSASPLDVACAGARRNDIGAIENVRACAPSCFRSLQTSFEIISFLSNFQ